MAVVRKTPSNRLKLPQARQVTTEWRPDFPEINELEDKIVTDLFVQQTSQIPQDKSLYNEEYFPEYFPNY